MDDDDILLSWRKYLGREGNVNLALERGETNVRALSWPTVLYLWRIVDLI